MPKFIQRSLMALLLLMLSASMADAAMKVVVRPTSFDRPAGPAEFTLVDPGDLSNRVLQDPDSGMVYPLEALETYSMGPVATTRVIAMLPPIPANTEKHLEIVEKPETVTYKLHSKSPAPGDDFDYISEREITVEEALPVVQMTDDEGKSITVQVQGDEKPFAVLQYGDEQVKPFLYPLLGPGGKRLTRGYPMEQHEGESTDHPHQSSFWTAYGAVNGVDFWHKGEQHGIQAVRRADVTASSPVRGTIHLDIDWKAPDGKVLLTEERAYHFYAMSDNARLMDITVELTGTDEPAVFGDTKEAGLIAARVHPDIREDRGGKLTSSNGASGAGEVWGKPAAWMDYSGTVEGQDLGMTLMDHLDNPGHPARWHARNYGLLGCNNIAYQAFDGDAEPTKFVINPGETKTFQYRVLLHDGGADDHDLAGYYQSFISPPVIDVISE